MPLNAELQVSLRLAKTASSSVEVNRDVCRMRSSAECTHWKALVRLVVESGLAC